MALSSSCGRAGWAVRVSMLVAVLFGPIRVMAQPAPPAPEPAAVEVAKPSVTHAMEKGVTFKLGTAAMWAVIGLVGTGSVIDAGVFSVFSTLSSYTVYVANDYFWDHLFPAPAAAVEKSFDASASAWRNTWKYLTFKPTINLINWTALYLYMGSFAASFPMSLTATLTVPVIFYSNNMIWDWYDFHSTQSTALVPARQ
jgi:hypothetical protein